MSTDNSSVLGVATVTGSAVAGVLLAKTGSLYTYAFVFAGIAFILVSAATLIKKYRKG